jgi:hypothetical protein
VCVVCLCVVWVLDVQILVLTLCECLYSAVRWSGVCYDSVEGRGVKGERGGVVEGMCGNR